MKKFSIFFCILFLLGLFLKDLRNDIYITFCVIVVSFTFLLHVPESIFSRIQSKPTYFVDLKEYQKPFYVSLLRVCMSLFIGVIFIYILDIKDKKVLEVIALLGGLISFYKRLERLASKIILRIAKIYKPDSILQDHDNVNAGCTGQSVFEYEREPAGEKGEKERE